MTTFTITTDPLFALRDDGIECRTDMQFYQEWIKSGGVPTPYKPSSCTMKQAREALIRSGYIAQVNIAFANMTGIEGDIARNTWERSPTVDKHDVLVQQLAPALNLTDAQLDDLFALAVTL